MKKYFLSILFVLLIAPLAFGQGMITIGKKKGECSGWNCGFTGDTNIVAWYRFESGALTTDSSETGNTLTASANSPTVDTVIYKEGSASSSHNYANAQHYYITDNNLSAGFPCKNGTTNNVFSVTAWVNADTLTSGYNHTIVSKWDSGESDRSFYCSIDADHSSQVRFTLGYNAGESSSTYYHGTTLDDDTWYHITCAYRDSDKTYSIRVRDASGNTVGDDIETTWENNINVEDGEFAIGSFYYNSAYYGGSRFNGHLDEVVIWNKFVSATESTNISKGDYK